MSDFSKALVIAVNLSAQKVYIFTNLHYSQETQKRIAKFSRSSSIQVELMIFSNFRKNKRIISRITKITFICFFESIDGFCYQHSESKKVVADRSIIPNIIA